MSTSYLDIIICKLNLLDCTYQQYIGAPWILREWFDFSKTGRCRDLNENFIRLYDKPNNKKFTTPYVFSEN